MEVLIVVLVVLVVLVVVAVAGGAGLALVASRRRGLDLEPPTRRTPPDPPRSAVPHSGPGVEAVPDDLVEEIDRALADVGIEAPAPPTEEPAPEPPATEQPTLRARLAKARGALAGYVGSIRSRASIDTETWDELEEALIRADVGVTTTTTILERLRATASAEGITDPDVLLDALKEQLKADLAPGDRALHVDPGGAPDVWLFVGVNGVGKTTTIGKVARQQIDAGLRVVMAAGDTFRAAAAEQLGTWAERTGAELVRGAEGGDPSSIIFDAVQRAAARSRDLVLADTAGRLHTKVNLMEELRKVRRVADRGPGRVREVLLVLDATTGQNGLVQARQFTEAVDLTGVVLTKLDGSAKGGIVLAIQAELGIPIKLVGLGEGVEDLVPFEPEEFVEALFEA